MICDALWPVQTLINMQSALSDIRSCTSTAARIDGGIAHIPVASAGIVYTHRGRLTIATLPAYEPYNSPLAGLSAFNWQEVLYPNSEQ